MEVFVHFEGTGNVEELVQVNLQGTDSIARLKKQLALQCGIDENRIRRVLCNGQVLSDAACIGKEFSHLVRGETKFVGRFLYPNSWTTALDGVLRLDLDTSWGPLHALQLETSKWWLGALVFLILLLSLLNH
ncbi:unnamed protein product [Ostreobium quekettii]|uniref:Ubiquitin-like domain-containing protein n=1 Tax=Ostreobium quekettii TaxID=121088 RepID=A0A8S1J0L1_9CHLO|nr:unnamed protein product [Ostreobium quekettii]